MIDGPIFAPHLYNARAPSPRYLHFLLVQPSLDSKLIISRAIETPYNVIPRRRDDIVFADSGIPMRGPSSSNDNLKRPRYDLIKRSVVLFPFAEQRGTKTTFSL